MRQNEHDNKSIMNPRPTKRAKRVHISKIEHFSLINDVEIGDMNRANMCHIANINHSTHKDGLYFQLSGGGTIPQSFGVVLSPDDKKYSITMSVDSDAEHVEFKRLQSEFVSTVQSKWSQWFPNMPKTDEELCDLCNNFVSDKKPRSDNSDATWPGLTKASCFKNAIKERTCKIVLKDSGLDIEPTELNGMKWVRAVFKLGVCYVQSSKSFGLTKSLVFIECVESGLQEAETVPVKELVLQNNMVLGTPNKLQMCQLITVAGKTGGRIIFRLQGGGLIPSFGAEQINDTKTVITLAIDNDEEHVELQRLSEELKDIVCAHRARLFPQCTLSDEILRTKCNPFVSARKEKNNDKSMWPGLTKATLYTKQLEVKKCSITYTDTEEQIDPINLPGMRWTSAVLELSFMYIQSSKAYGITKQLRKLECDESNTVEIIPI